MCNVVPEHFSPDVNDVVLMRTYLESFAKYIMHRWRSHQFPRHQPHLLKISRANLARLIHSVDVCREVRDGKGSLASVEGFATNLEDSSGIVSIGSSVGTAQVSGTKQSVDIPIRF